MAWLQRMRPVATSIATSSRSTPSNSVSSSPSSPATNRTSPAVNRQPMNWSEPSDHSSISIGQ